MLKYGKSKWPTLITVYFIIGWPYADISIEILGYWINLYLDRTGMYETEQIKQLSEFSSVETLQETTSLHDVGK